MKSQLSFPPSLLTTLSEDIFFVTTKPYLSGSQRPLPGRTLEPQKALPKLSSESSFRGGHTTHSQRYNYARPTRDTNFLLGHLLGQLDMRCCNYSGAWVTLDTNVTLCHKGWGRCQEPTGGPAFKTRRARGTRTWSQMTQKVPTECVPPSVQNLPSVGHARVRPPQSRMKCFWYKHLVPQGDRAA